MSKAPFLMSLLFASLSAAQTYQPNWEFARPPADAGMVHRRQVRHLHPLGRLLGAGLRAGDPRQARLRRVVLARRSPKGRSRTQVRSTPAAGSMHKKLYGADYPVRRTSRRSSTRSSSTRRIGPMSSQRSGAKYVALTSKHHEGFALWPSNEASKTWGRPWNAVEIGPHRDLLGDLSDAVRAKGLQDGHLLFALRVVQPALAHRQAALRRRAHDAAVQGRGHALQARPSSSATASGK